MWLLFCVTFSFMLYSAVKILRFASTYRESITSELFLFFSKCTKSLELVQSGIDEIFYSKY
jgi:hypothetical protein